MADAVAGRPYTFQVLFVDETNSPVAVADPTITIFSFSQAGVKQVLIQSAAMQAAVPAEVGRYTYVYAVPGAYSPGDNIFVEMTATDPGLPGTRFLIEDSISIVSASAAAAGSSGLAARFVKGG